MKMVVILEYFYLQVWIFRSRDLCNYKKPTYSQDFCLKSLQHCRVFICRFRNYGIFEKICLAGKFNRYNFFSIKIFNGRGSMVAFAWDSDFFRIFYTILSGKKQRTWSWWRRINEKISNNRFIYFFFGIVREIR